MEPLTAVGRGHNRPCTVLPGRNHAVDRARVEVRSVGEDDDRCLDILSQLLEPAAQRRAWAAFPFEALDRPRFRLDLVGADDYEHVVHLARAHA